VDPYLAYLRQLSDEHQCVLVVGHNPGLEDVLEKLTGRFERLTTAALAHVTLKISEWRELSASPQGQLIHVWRPSDLPDSGESGASATNSH
jgi:phosphohistidine phosphatase